MRSHGAKARTKISRPVSLLFKFDLPIATIGDETHASTIDPEARLYRKGPGKEAKLCFIGHALMENRHGLIVDACLTPADGHAERTSALHLIEPRADRPRAITLGADKAYDAKDFVNELRAIKVTPHVAQNTSRRASAIDGRTTRHAGYAISQRIRKKIEEGFGWIKTIAGQDIPIFVAPPRSTSARRGAAKSPSAPCRRRSTSNTAGPP